MHVVLDVGKTISKLSLWNSEGQEIARRDRHNKSVLSNGYAALDVEGIENWVVEILKEYSKIGAIKGIIPVAHGAGCAIIKNGKLALLPMDYEWEIPKAITEEYIKLRDDFYHNGSPLMGAGLNFGIQLFYLKKQFPDIFRGDYRVLPWAQYWAWSLCGNAFCEISSFGSHSDLWSLGNNAPSNLAFKLGFAEHFVPFKKANEVAGQLKPELAERTGLAQDIDVYTGIHDSNAALYLTRQIAPLRNQSFTIISTGTWFVLMRALIVGEEFDIKRLNPKQNTLVNIDCDGMAVPTALFMGGREIELLLRGNGIRLDLAENQNPLLSAAQNAIDNCALILPSAVKDVGPFGDRDLSFINKPTEKYQFSAMVAIYIALVCDYCLDLIDSPQIIVIDGRFGQSKVITGALAALRKHAKIYVKTQDADLALGALSLAKPDIIIKNELELITPMSGDFDTIRNKWRAFITQAGQ